MSQQELLEKVYEELTKVRHLLEILAKDELQRELERVATTKERRMIWTLCDGLTTTDEIAQKIGISQRAVQIVVKELVEADLITVEMRGRPKRVFEYVPSTWRIG